MKDVIKKMILERDSLDDAKMMMDEDDIKHRFDALQKWCNEARSCISDCQEACESQQYDAELKTANDAVDKSFASFVDLIEDLQHLDDKDVQQYSQLRLESVTKLRSLRQELDLLQSKQK